LGLGRLGIWSFFASLPWYYDTYWWDGAPYYYADDVHYQWNGDANAYETVQPPAALTVQVRAQTPVTRELFAYPKAGQSSEQQATDREKRHRWAVAQSGFESTDLVPRTSTESGRNGSSTTNKSGSSCPTLRTRRFKFRPFVLADISPLTTLAGEHSVADTTIGVPTQMRPGWSMTVYTQYKTPESRQGLPWQLAMHDHSWESVRFPAGHFTALRYRNQINFRFTNASERVSAQREENIWLAPEIGRWVACESWGTFYQDVGERFHECSYRWELLSWT
jgi:hypothetical protein